MSKICELIDHSIIQSINRSNERSTEISTQRICDFISCNKSNNQPKHYLIKGLVRDVDSVNFNDFVVDGEDAGALGETARHESGYENARYFVQPRRRHFDTHTVPNVESCKEHGKHWLNTIFLIL